MMSLPNAYEPNMPPGYEQYEHLLLYTMFFLVLNKLIISGFGTGHEPQFFAARDERECGKLACLWAVLMTFRWPMMIGYAILGLYLVHDFVPDQAVLAASRHAYQGDPGPHRKPVARTVGQSSRTTPRASTRRSSPNLQAILGDTVGADSRPARLPRNGQRREDPALGAALPDRSQASAA